MIRLRSSSCFAAIRQLRPMSTSANPEEYSQEPQYPPIKDITWRGRRKDEAEAWHEKIQNLDTVEEKLIEINIPRYYGWKCHMLTEGDIKYNTLALHQHITRTHLVNGLPAIYNSNEIEAAAQQHAAEIKSEFADTLAFEWNRQSDLSEDASPREMEKVRTQRIMESLNSILISNLRKHLPHLKDVVVDPQPRLEAAWNVGGFELEQKTKNLFELKDDFKPLLTWPRDRRFQYIGSPVLQVRANHPLEPILGEQESTNAQLEVPHHEADPRVHGNFTTRRYMTMIPGVWPGDDHRFGTISFHGRDYQLTEKLKSFPEEDKIEALHSQAILASFSWLFSQACYLGFSTFNDVTYPLVSQTVISNGQHWSFYTYQLNTLLLHFENTSKNPKRNICWSSQPLKLFESIENGTINGFNDEVLKTLVKFYMNEPRERKGVELTPYLHPEVPMVMKIENEDKRVFLEDLFKKICRNGKKTDPDPEYWNWEWIYKIKFKTRPHEARRRPFELWQNPWRTTFNETPPKYVPKALRKDPKDRRQKFEKTYYP
ncbi:large ribosomal subunit protein mL65 [Neocloeon triangulifer]|uniref:large ribosomal subunit protein mL65 n=1 Tax=Neocloeon triangulifer TaxID=2078957 RepID=UPI00286FA5E4|nr:large ribosomal subunit protein mL65 [Neocloeon triangulifer]